MVKIVRHWWFPWMFKHVVIEINGQEAHICNGWQIDINGEEYNITTNYK